MLGATHQREAGRLVGGIQIRVGAFQLREGRPDVVVGADFNSGGLGLRHVVIYVPRRIGSNQVLDPVIEIGYADAGVAIEKCLIDADIEAF